MRQIITVSIPIPALTIVSMVAGFAFVNAQAASAGDVRGQRPMAGLPAAGSTAKLANPAPDPKPPLPPRPAGLQSGDQIQLIYDARTNRGQSVTFGRIVEIRKAGQPSETPTTTTTVTHDHRGKSASKPPSTPPGAPPPAAPPSALVAPPAAPPGTVPVPPASGKVVRTH